MYRLDLERRIFINILYEIAVDFIPLFVKWYNNRLLPLIRQFFPIPNRNNEYMDGRQ
jgi:hypothetical protein